MALEADPPWTGDIGDPTTKPRTREAGPVVDRQEERVLEAVAEVRKDGEGAGRGASHGGERPRDQPSRAGSRRHEGATMMQAGDETNGHGRVEALQDGSRIRDGPEPGTVRVEGGKVQGSPGPELVERLCQARANVERVERNGYNDYLDHEYATYDDVMRAVAEPMAEAGVWCLDSVVETHKREAGTTKDGKPRFLVTMVLETVWTDGQSSFRSYWTGEVLDTGDKHHYHLLSQLTKYAYAKTLKLDTGERGVDADHEKARDEADGDRSNGAKGGGSGVPATQRQLSYIRNLQERCRARGGTEEEHDVLGAVARSKEQASAQIEELKRLEDPRGGECR